MRDALRKMRHFLMTTKGLMEDEAISLMSVAVDFGITHVVDGNWGVHAVVKKSLFAGASPPGRCSVRVARALSGRLPLRLTRAGVAPAPAE